MSILSKKQKSFSKIPTHIAFIVDGNGRWAKKYGMPRNYGHKCGVDAIKKIIDSCSKFGIKVASFFIFSTENWARPKDEVDYIFQLAKDMFEKTLNEYKEKNYRIHVIGEVSKLDSEMQEIISKAVTETQDNDGLIVNFAINYGGRDEIVRACNSLIKSGKEEVTKQDFEQALYTCKLPDPDIVIRTSGEIRISNFMLYQMAYSELFFPKKYWPDFKEKDLYKVLIEYQGRDRRYGKLA